MTSLLIPSFFLWVFSLFNQFGIKPRFGMSQLSYIAAGIIAFLIIKRIGRRFFLANIKAIFWSFFALLIVTFIIGLEVKGSKRWIDFGFANLQASEYLKIFFIMFIAKLLSSRTRYEMTPFFYITVLFVSLLPAFIVLRQPDLGNASVFVGVLIFMLLVSDIPKRYLVVSGILVFILLPFSWFFLHDYQQARIVSFIQPHSDTQGDAYNMIQAIITVGSGQFFGKGLGLGTQSRLFFLPENNTDFAFSSLVEQFGFLGGFFVLVLEFILILMLFIRAYKFIGGNDSDTRYKYLYSMGLAFLLCIQTGVNIGMNLGLLPIAGIALPFISYGGSFFVALCIGFALLKS
ncbi:MAG: FtsW/RodA/SpoVE family cell cycle protein [Candidatus Roizmanbacteria bacterium]|nr:FtsW/RodA/SpoVE family cell cycle protein [Candidatus Roizmanbacteria bacterium]